MNRSKRIRNGRRLKAASPLVPGPGSRALPAEIMRHLLFPGPVGPTGLGLPWRFPLLVGAAGGRLISPPHPAEIGRSLPEKGSPGRCFLRATPLTPGHDPSIPEMSIPPRAGSPAGQGVYSSSAKKDQRSEFGSLSLLFAKAFSKMLLDLTWGDLCPLTPALSPEAGERGG